MAERHRTSLTGRIAIVTGGAVRLGAAIVQALQAEGVAVCIHCHRHQEEAARLVKMSLDAGIRSTFIAADLRTPGPAAETIVAHCVNTLGTPDILIHSASVFGKGRLLDSTEQEWQQQLAIHLVAPAMLTREFARLGNATERRHIVQILDARCDRPPVGRIAYSTSKAALASLTRMLAVELAPGIAVNGVAPGAVLPPEDDPRDHERRAAATIPLARRGEPQDVVDAVLFLLKSRFVTGEIVHVAGGEDLG